jgi:hypothetical protein
LMQSRRYRHNHEFIEAAPRLARKTALVAG